MAAPGPSFRSESLTQHSAARQITGVVLVLTAAVGFAVGPTAAKLAYNSGSNILTVVTLRGLIGGVLLGLLIAAFRQGFAMDRAAMRWTLFCSAFNAVMVYGLMGSVAYIPVSIAILIFFTHPILVALIVHHRGSDRLTISKAIFATGAFGGLALALAPTIENVSAFGIMLAALSAIAISGAILCAARAQRTATSTQVNFYITAFTTVAFVILTSALRDWSFPADTLGWIGIVAAGVAIAVGLLCFFAAFRYLGPLRATMLSNIEPLISVLFAAAILGEQLRPLQWIGVAVMICAIVLFELEGQEQQRSDAAKPN